MQSAAPNFLDTVATVADIGARTTNLEREQAKTDKSIERVEDKLDNLKIWIMTTLAAAIGGIATHFLK
jgi:hypothetical protein